MDLQLWLCLPHVGESIGGAKMRVQNLPIIWEFSVLLEESKSSSWGLSEVWNAFCQPIKNVQSAAVWNRNPTSGSPWLLAEPEQTSSGRRSIATLLWPAWGTACHRLAAQPQITSQKWHNCWLNQRETFRSAPGKVWKQGEAQSSTCRVLFNCFDRLPLFSPSQQPHQVGLPILTLQMWSPKFSCN